MSRAFVREVDDAPPPPLPERPVSTAPNRVTPRGARQIGTRVETLEQQLSREPNGDAAPSLRRDLRYWLARQASMQVMPVLPRPMTVGFGTRVTIRRGSVERIITIVGEDEADPSAGHIAWTAPLSRALEDAGIGDVVELEAGGHVDPVTVIGIAAGAGGEDDAGP